MRRPHLLFSISIGVYFFENYTKYSLVHVARAREAVKGGAA